MTGRWIPEFRHVEGYSPVDHIGGELARICEYDRQTYATRAGAIRGGERLLVRVVRERRQNGEGVWRHNQPRIDVSAREVTP